VTDDMWRRRSDGYLPIEGYGLIGDGTTAALVGVDGSVDWLCVPRFDSPPLFCALLDSSRGGRFSVAPDELISARHCYAGDSGVLVSELRAPTGVVRLTDLLTLHAGADLAEDAAASRGELLREVEVLHGHVKLRVEIAPRGGAQAERVVGGLRLRCGARPDLDLQIASNAHLEGPVTTHDLGRASGSTCFCAGAGGRSAARSSPSGSSSGRSPPGRAGWTRSPTKARRKHSSGARL
jgi:hypothetical protein